MTQVQGWVWTELENLADLESKRDEAKAEVAELDNRVRDVYSRLTAEAHCSTGEIAATVTVIRAIGSPLDIDNPREPADPLDIPPHLDRRAGSDEGDPD